MEAQLKELIEKIKTDGVKSGEEQAASIIAEAEKKAAAIIADAEQKAEQLKVQAQSDAQRFERSGNDALAQAGRNLLIELRKSIEGMLNAIVQAETAQSLKGKALSESIGAVMKAWTAGESSDLTLLVPAGELKSLEKDLMDKLSDQMKKGLELKPFAELEAGFRISSRDGKMFYDFSDQELSRMISRYLNRRLQEILEK